MLPQYISDAAANARRYAKMKSLTTEKVFGYGQEGYVLQTNKMTAVKAFYFPQHYRQELEVYQYLKLWRITEVAGFHIRQLISHVDQLKIIEMTVVAAPFIVDFVGARIDLPFDRDDGWLANTMDLFEKDWDRVKFAIWELEKHGVYLSDIHPGNIRCG